MIGLSSRPHARTFISTLTQMGLTTGLELCLDAGDANSYTSGTKWLDTSGHGYDFDFGAGAAAPTFNGAAGGKSLNEYFSFDAADYFTYDTTNETWMDNIHKDNATWSFAVWINFADFLTTNQPIVATLGNSANNIGFVVFAGVSAQGVAQVGNASGTLALNQSTATVGVAATWRYFGISLTETTGAGGILWNKTGSADTDTSTYSSPSASAATYTMQIAAGGNNTLPMHAGGKIAELAMWSSALTAEQLQNIYHLTKGRFGL